MLLSRSSRGNRSWIELNGAFDKIEVFRRSDVLLLLLFGWVVSVYY